MPKYIVVELCEAKPKTTELEDVLFLQGFVAAQPAGWGPGRGGGGVPGLLDSVNPSASPMPCGDRVP